jgi:hypothetical protein
MNPDHICQDIQNTAAVGLALDEKQREHYQTCLSCREKLETLEQLDQWVLKTPLPELPKGLATQIMQNIERYEPQSLSKEAINLFSNWRDEWGQFIVGLLGLLFTTGSLLRFIFSVWLVTAIAN